MEGAGDAEGLGGPLAGARLSPLFVPTCHITKNRVIVGVLAFLSPLLSPLCPRDPLEGARRNARKHWADGVGAGKLSPLFVPF